MLVVQVAQIYPYAKATGLFLRSSYVNNALSHLSQKYEISRVENDMIVATPVIDN